MDPEIASLLLLASPRGLISIDDVTVAADGILTDLTKTISLDLELGMVRPSGSCAIDFVPLPSWA